MSDEQSFSSSSMNLLVRAYYTPVLDALRGELSASLDIRGAIAAAGLPAPVAGVIYTVAMRTRLWRSEKVDVARELAAHFAEGLAAGRTAEQLIAAFGSPRDAARLIRKAKLRNRPRWWRSLRLASRAFLILLAVGLLGYCGAAARFFLSKPRIGRNYLQELYVARQAPEDERAWPLYRTALLKIEAADRRAFEEYEDAQPGSKHWDSLVAWLERNRASIELARQAAQKPRLSYLPGAREDYEAAQAAQAGWLLNDPFTDANPLLYAVLHNGIYELSGIQRWFLADMRHAANAGDGAMVVANARAVVSLDDQLIEPPAFLFEQLVGLVAFENALNLLGDLLAKQPALFSDSQLDELSKQITRFRRGQIIPDFSMEDQVFEDLLQRAYTDDGQGNGHLTSEGLELLAKLVGQDNLLAVVDATKVTSLAQTLLPGVAALIASREENRALYYSLVTEMKAAHQGPPWRWNREQFESKLRLLNESKVSKLKYLPVLSLLPPVDGMWQRSEQVVQVRDVMLTAIALVRWHRLHGDWPATLDELVPELLPAVPVDRHDGQALRYLVRDGQPVLYSVGADRDDDQGRLTERPEWASCGFGQIPAEEASWNRLPGYDGDWVLWPPVIEQPADDETD